MTTTRRDFLRALAAGTGLVMVPKALDRFRWKARPSGVIVADEPVYTVTWWYEDGHVETVNVTGNPIISAPPRATFMQATIIVPAGSLRVIPAASLYA